MPRFHFPAFFMLLAALVTAACPRHEELHSQRQAEQGRADAPPRYTVRLIFDGLVTFVTPDHSSDPGKLWVLVGNATDPSRLTVGRGMAAHENHLLIEHLPGVRVSGRTLDIDGTSVGLGREWRGVRLNNEDLRLVGDLRTPLGVVRGTGRPPHPCIPGPNCTQQQAERQREDFEWVLDIDDALARVGAGTSQERRLRDCLVEETFSCRDATPLLSARLKLVNGRVFAQRLYRQGSTTFVTYNFGGRFPFDARALAEEVAVEFDVVGPLQLVSSRLDGSAGSIQPIAVEADRSVIIRIGNHAPCRHTGTCTDSVNDFLLNFNFLNRPDFVGEANLPVPEEIRGPGPEFGAQCSPGSFVGGN